MASPTLGGVHSKVTGQVAAESGSWGGGIGREMEDVRFEGMRDERADMSCLNGSINLTTTLKFFFV